MHRRIPDGELKRWLSERLPPLPGDLSFDRDLWARSTWPRARRIPRIRSRRLFSGAAGLVAALLLAAGWLTLHQRAPAPSFAGAPVRHQAALPTPTRAVRTTPLSTWPAGSRPGSLPASAAITALTFLTPQDGFAAGHGIYFSADAGRQWVPVYTGSAGIQGLTFVNPSIGFAWGYHAILSTVDGGLQWRLAGSVQETLQSIDWVTGNVGYAVGEGNGPLLKTTDGGRRWTILRQSASSVSFVGPNRGWALNGETAWHTTNGGRSWSASTIVAGASGSVFGGQIAALPDGTVWVLLRGVPGMNQDSYTVFRSGNGQSWTAVLSRSTADGPAPGNPNGTATAPGLSPGPLVAVSPETAWVSGVCAACGVGTTTVAVTQNGGRTWTTGATVSGLVPPAGLSAVNAEVGWLATQNAGAWAVRATRDAGMVWTRDAGP